MQEHALKATIIALFALLTLLMTFGAFLIAGTQQGNTAPIIKSTLDIPDGDAYSRETLFVEDKKLSSA